MKLKTVEIDGKTYAELQDGKPIFVDDAGKDHTYDAPAMAGSLKRLNTALADERKAKDDAVSALAPFEGLDPAKAREALKVTANLDDKKLIDAGEVDRVKQDMAQAFQKKLDAAIAERDALEKQYAAEKVTAAFAGSKFVKEKLTLPPDLVQSAFAQHFQFKDGRITPVDQNGNPISSDSNPGDIASFDEALEIVVNRYPHRDAIMKGNGQSGSGSGPVNGGDGAGKRTVTREQFNAMSAAEQRKAATSPDVQIVDN